MSTYYQRLDRPGGFDYELYEIPGLGSRTFRGPPADTSAPYLAFIGGAQTFGRFASEPYPTLLGARLGIPVLNLGAGGAGPRYFEAPELLRLINGAEAVVVQVMSGRSASNSMFDNSESGAMIGRLRSDQSPLRSDAFFVKFAQSCSEIEFKKVVDETRDDYMSSFVKLLQNIVVPKILLWFSIRQPQYVDDFKSLPFGVLKAFPQLVNGSMAKELAAFSDEYVECVSDAGLPNRLWQSDQPVPGLASKEGTLENRYYPSPAMHGAAADALEAACRRFLGRNKPSSQAAHPKKFVVVAAGRTGTNLLLGLLNDYDGCFVGNELFNPVHISNDFIPWRDIQEPERAALLELRQSDPVAFWKSLCDRSEAGGYRAIGFKLLYGHGLSQKALLDHLAGDDTISIVHIVRRNLLRRLVSERQAYATGKWAAGAAAPAEARPAVTSTMSEIVSSFQYMETQQAAFDSMFANHPMIKVVYEDLARRPFRTALRVAAFLGLKYSPTATIKYQKTGSENLSEALIDFDSLRAKFRRWSSFFDE